MCREHIHREYGVASTETLRIFREYRSRKFIFVEPGGNFGDYLIYKGAEKLAKIAKLNFSTVDFNGFLTEYYPDDVIIYIHGSGGLVSWWSGTPFKILKKASMTHKGMVILAPQTCSKETDFLKGKFQSIFQNNICKEIILFTREQTSYEILKSIAGENVFLDHDTALNLTANDFPGLILKNQYNFFAIRKDKENIAFSDGVSGIWLDPSVYCKNFNHWLFVHSKAEEIVTNRLHSATIGSILNKKVTLLPNSYHKNRSVWEYSLAQRGVRWAESIPEEYYSTISKIPYYQRFLRYFNKIRFQDMP